MTEVMLSSKDEAFCISKLVDIIAGPSRNSKVLCLNSRPSFSEAAPPNIIVALHLLILFFVRRRYICVRAFSYNRIPDLLCSILTGKLWVDSIKPDQRSKILTQAAILLDLYDRNVVAMRLRELTVRNYSNRHTWYWFDESACRWHAYGREEFRRADEAFHNGVFRSTFEERRRSNMIDFYLLIQTNGDSLVRRPIALFPKLPCFNDESSDSLSSSSSSVNYTNYEREMLGENEPEVAPLSPSQRHDLCVALVKYFKDGGLDARCTEAFSRLLLRLAAGSFDDVETLYSEDVLPVLFDFTAEMRVSVQFSGIVGHLIRQLFDDEATLTETMRLVIGQFLRGGTPMLHWGYRDLFYTIPVLTPLISKNEKIALSLMKELADIDITEESLKEGSPSSSLLMSLDPTVDDVKCCYAELTDRQKSIVTLLINRIFQASTSSDAIVGSLTSTTTTPSVAEANNQGDGSPPNTPTNPTPSSIRICKSDYLRYLADLCSISRGVVEFIAKFHLTPQESLLSHFFSHQLRDSTNMELIVLILESILFSSCSSIQIAVMAEFKNSLRCILASSMESNLVQAFAKNQLIVGHMRFLECALALPPPMQSVVIRQVYKRQIAADVGKLIAAVHCNVLNSALALNSISKGLEDLSKVDQQIQRRLIQLSEQSKNNISAENHVTVVTTVPDNMMHTASTETTQPMTSAVVPTIVLLANSVHPPSAATTPRQQTQQPSTPSRQHFTEEGDTWAMAEDAGDEMEDTTVEDSNAILILDEVVDTRGNSGGGGGVGVSGGEEDNTDDARQIDDSYADDEDEDQGEGNAYHDLEDADGDEEDEEDEEEVDDNENDEDGGDEVDTADEIEDEEDDDVGGEYGQADVIEHVVEVGDLADAHAHGNNPSDAQNDMMLTLVNEVFNTMDNSVGSGVSGTRGSQGRRRLNPDHSLIFHFTSLSGADGVTNWGSSTHHPGDRVYELSTSSRPPINRFGIMPVQPGPVVSADQGIARIAFPTSTHRNPLLTAPTTFLTAGEVSGNSGMRSLGGGVSESLAALNLRPLRALPTSRRDPGISSAIFTLLPPNFRAVSGAGGGYTRIVTNPPAAPILVHTNFGSMAQMPVPAVPSSVNVSHLGMPYQFAYEDTLPSVRTTRRRLGGQTSSSSGRFNSEVNEVDGDLVVWEMLADFCDFQSRAITEALGSGVNSATAPITLIFNVLNIYRHYTDLALILRGHEIMDMTMLARREVGVAAVLRRNDDFDQQLAEYHLSVQEAAKRHQREQEESANSTTVDPSVGLDEITPSLPNPPADSGPLLQRADSDIGRCLSNPFIRLLIRLLMLGSLFVADSFHEEDESVPLNPDIINAQNPSSTSVPAADESAAPASSTLEPTDAEAVEPPVPSTSTTSVPETSNQEPAPQAIPIRVPVTDEEIIASMVTEGVDPSFLDALPEDMRRELMLEHQRTIRLRSQLSSIQNAMPEHVDEAFLASLPPNIQEEVLAQVRQTASAAGGNVEPSNTATGGTDGAGTSATAAVDNSNNTNAAFIAALPDDLRRDVLMDMEDFQIEHLTPEMQWEARRLRRNFVGHAAMHTSVFHGPRRLEQFRNLPSRIFPGVFSPLRTSEGGAGGGERIGRNPPRRSDTHFSHLHSLTLGNLQSMFSSTSGSRTGTKPLLDYEGMTCVITLLIASSTSHPLRRYAFPMLKHVLQNLCSHASSRTWIISTIIHIISNLSENPLPPPPTDLLNSKSPGGALSIIATGFDAALGSWVRNLELLPNGSFVVHPKAANYVADIVRVSASPFFPVTLDANATSSPPVNSAGDREPAEVKTDFWEILARISRSGVTLPTSNVGMSSCSGSPRKSLSISPARSRKCTETTSIPPSCSADANERPQVDYFSNLVGLLRHPVVMAKPVLQEKLLFLLVQIVNEFFKANVSVNGSNARRNAQVVADSVSAEAPPVENTSATGTAETSGTSATSLRSSDPSTTPSTPDLIVPLSPSVVQSLCDFVMAKNSTDQSRILATGLILLMSRVNSSSRDNFFRIMAQGASELALAIKEQLTAVINEINQLSPSSKHRRQRQRTTSGEAGPSAGTPLQPSASMTRLPDRFNSNSLAPPPPPLTGGELELASLQPLISSRSQQSRLCRILRLMLNLSFPPNTTMQSIESLPSLWQCLSRTLECLQETSDANTALLFQPLVECLCLAHASPTQITCTVNLYRPPLYSLSSRHGGHSAAGLSSWSDSFLPSHLGIPFMGDDQNIILFDWFPEVQSSATPEAAATASPSYDLTRPMSPPSWSATESASESSDRPQQQPSISTTQEITPTGSNFITWFSEKHRVSLNHILRHYVGNISESAFTVFLSNPKNLDFDVKRRFFRQRFASLRSRSPHRYRSEEENITVSRDRIFEDSFTRLHSKSAEVWKRKFVIRFQHEEGQDAGGLLREWYLLMSREIFNPNYCLFRVSPSDRVTYTINPASFINSNHLSYFRFVGRFIAKAIYDNKLLECYFTRSFYKHILGRRVR